MQRTRALVFVVAMALIASSSACGGGRGPDFTIGFKRLALDLNYKDEKLPESTVPATQVQIPSEVSYLAPSFVAPRTQAPIPKSRGCPVADPEDKPLHPATVFVSNPPAVGIYTTHIKGEIDIGLAQPIKLGLPAHGLLEIRNIVHNPTTSDPVNGPLESFNYDVFVPSLDGGTTTTYQVKYYPSTLPQQAGATHEPNGELDLLRLQVKSATGNNLDFNPDPPITIMAFKTGQGTTWNSAGADQVTGTSMVVSGSVNRRVNVDVCGNLYDTYEVLSNEHIVNLESGFRSDTDAQNPNVYRVATNLGGLFIQEDRHTTTTYTDSSGTATSYTLNSEQTFDSVTPAGPPT